MSVHCGFFLPLIMSMFFFTKISLHLQEKKKGRAELLNPSFHNSERA
jgi:hypothetical protein